MVTKWYFYAYFDFAAGIPGITIAPGFWPGRHGPSQRASITVLLPFWPAMGGLMLLVASTR